MDINVCTNFYGNQSKSLFHLDQGGGLTNGLTLPSMIHISNFLACDHKFVFGKTSHWFFQRAQTSDK